MASANSSTFMIIGDFRDGAPLADFMVEVKFSGMEEKLGFILQGDKSGCKLVVNAGAGIGMAIKVEAADDGEMVVKVELLPAVPNVEIAESNEMGGAANFKVKMD